MKHHSTTSAMAAVISVGLSVLLGAAAAARQQPPAPGGAAAAQAMTVHTVKPGMIYWVAGGGGNSGIIIGPSGVVVIDAKTTVDGARQLIAEVAKLTPKPITHVILTHSDGDHVNGLPAFPADVKIIAHENNKKEQQATFIFAAVEVDGGKCLPPADRLPNQVVMADKVATRIDGVNFVLYHFGPAHTSGDLVVHLPDDKVTFTGDLLTSTVLVHFEKGGSFDGWFANARGLLSLDTDKYIGGHANTEDTKATVQKRIDEYQATKDKVDGFIKQGKSLAEIHAAMGDPAKNATGCRGIPYLSLAEIEYMAQQDRNQAIK